MNAQTALLVTLAAAFAVAFLFGFGAAKLRMPPLVGYLLAGVVLGPQSPLAAGDVALAGQLAEIGVILLMFGVGLHFSPGDLQRVRGVALPGALLQMACATAMGYLLAATWGWSPAAALLFGVSLSTASTVVMLRMLEDRGLLDGADGRLGVAWLVVQDLAVVLLLVLLPAVLSLLGVAGAIDTKGEPMGWVIALTLLKVMAFIALMAVVGRRAVPWLLTHVVRTGSRELFTLAVLGVALGVAVGAAVLFGVSFALGAFVAGVVISESDLSYRAGTDALPMQDAFAVIFFVSAGMLIDPSIMLREPGKVAATVGVILFGNLLVSTLLLVWMRHPLSPSLYLGAGLGQIGEFSFILAAYGVSLGLLSADGRSLILASALCTIVANPLVFRAMDALNQWLSRYPRLLDRLERTQATRAMMTDLWMATPINHVILVGYGRVGRTVGQALLQAGTPFIAIEQDRRVIDLMRQLGVNAVFGDATRGGILDHARPEMAQLLILTTPDPYHARQVIELARARNPELQIIVRTQGETNQALLEQLGVRMVLLAERELAYGMAYHALRAAGSSDDKADWVIASLRGGARMPTQEFKAMMTPPAGTAAQS